MKLEDCIKKNKAAFNDEIPLQGHMNRFDVRLKQFTNHTRTYHLIKRTALSVSAIIIVLLGIGYLCWHPTKPISHNHSVLLTKFDVSSEIVAKDTNMQQQPSTQNILPLRIRSTLRLKQVYRFHNSLNSQRIQHGIFPISKNNITVS